MTTDNVELRNADLQKEVERLKAQLQCQLEIRKARLASIVQHERVAADIALNAIRGMILVSGGAILALLTFIGNLWTKNDELARVVAHDMQSAEWAFGCEIAPNRDLTTGRTPALILF